MAAPTDILRLIERFAEQRDVYHSGQYKEAGIRVEFIDPFFKALGWDINNERGYAEAYKDVIHEDALKIGGATEAPDSCFCQRALKNTHHGALEKHPPMRGGCTCKVSLKGDTTEHGQPNIDGCKRRNSRALREGVEEAADSP